MKLKKTHIFFTTAIFVVQVIIKIHKLSLIGSTTRLPGLFYGPWWYYFLIPPFLLSGGNPQGIVLFMGFVGFPPVFSTNLEFKYRTSRSLENLVVSAIRIWKNNQRNNIVWRYYCPDARSLI
jgi:hypothetical protein